MGLFTRDIGIDLGTANSLVHMRNKELSSGAFSGCHK